MNKKSNGVVALLKTLRWNASNAEKRWFHYESSFFISKNLVRIFAIAVWAKYKSKLLQNAASFLKLLLLLIIKD